MSFVGREVELAALRTALESTRGGRGQIAIFSGDAGIGKTSTIRAFAEVAKAEGFCVLWGLCNDDLGAPLFWPWLQLIRGWVASRGDEGLTDIFAGDAESVARLVPELATRLPNLAKGNTPGAKPDDSAQTRFQFFHAIAQFWRKASGEQPLLLVIDDLQQDASASLKLLGFIAEAISDGRVLIVAAYRESDLRPEHPLNDVITELLRRDNFRRLRLGGLDPAGTAWLLEMLIGSYPPPLLSEAVFVHSEGNPLFIQELARELLRQHPSESWHHGTSLRLPDTIRLLFEQRLNRASPNCRHILNVAAVIGRQFDQSMLAQLLPEISLTALGEALEEALLFRVIEGLSQLGHYQFSHALLHETVYESIPPPRRLGFHRDVAEWLERRGDHDSDVQLPRLAFHFTRCAALGLADKAIHYLKRAARRADELYSHREAVEYYLEALRLDRELGESERAELLLALAYAQMRLGANETAGRTFLEAAELARKRTDYLLFARAAQGFENTGWRQGRDGQKAVALLEEALARVAPSDRRTTAELNSALCRANIYARRPREAIIAHRLAVRTARELGEPHTLFRALCAIVAAKLWPELLEARLEAATEALALAESCGRPDWSVLHLTGWSLYDFLEAGDVQTARRVLDLHVRIADILRDPFLQTVGQSAKTALRMQRDVGPSVIAEIKQTLALGRRWSVDNAAGAYGLQMFTLQRELGQLDDLRPVLKSYLFNRGPGTTWRAALILIYLELGMTAEAAVEFESISVDAFSRIPHDALWAVSIVYLAEACVRLNAVGQAETLYEKLLAYSGHNIVSAGVCLGSADRYLGMLAALLKEWDRCNRHFTSALALDEHCDHPIWLAHSKYQYASALICRNSANDRERAADLLKQALSTSEHLGLIALKRHCLALRERLATHSQAPDSLSPREIRVLRLLAAGASNNAIASKLFISPHTVANHVRNILAKTNCENRTQAAAYALRHGLAEPQ